MGKHSDTPDIQKAVALHKAGNLHAALEIYSHILKQNPDHGDALHLAGLTSAMLGDFDSAERFLQKSVVLYPTNRLFLIDYGVFYIQTGQFTKALTVLEPYICRNPDDINALFKVASVYRIIKKYANAVELFDRITGLNPHHNDALCNAGTCWLELRHYEKAQCRFLRVLEREPHNSTALNNLGLLGYATGDLPSAINYFKQALAIQPDSLPILGNYLFCLNYLPDISPNELFEIHKQYMARFPFVENTLRINIDSRKIRVGFVSGDFCKHPIGYFLLPLFRAFDRQLFEFHCFAENVASDAITDQLKSYATSFSITFGRSSLDIKDEIGKKKIDILIDCSGHTAGNRLDVFLVNPAPITITWLGYANTIGHPCMMFRISDLWCDDATTVDLYTEHTLQFADPPFFVYEPDPLSRVQERPDDVATVFGSTHTPARLNDTVLNTWATILQADKHSKLLIFRTTISESVKERIIDFFVNKNIDADRITIQTQLQSGESHFDIYGKMDILLDTFPWSGHTTALEALSCGVPVITLKGDRYQGKIVSEILALQNQSDFIATSVEEYCVIAMKAAADIAEIRRRRHLLRESLLHSSVCDSEKFARKFEDLCIKVIDQFNKKYEC